MIFASKINVNSILHLNTTEKIKKYNKSKVEEEMRYIQSLIKSEIKFSSSDSLKQACEFKIIITLSSNFAMELFSKET